MTPRDVLCSPHDSARILAALLAHSDDAVIRADLNAVITGWSLGAARLYGYTADETIGAPLGMLIPENHLDELVSMLDQIRAGTAVHHRETVRRAKDGAVVPVRLSMVPVADESTGTINVLFIDRDLTAAHQAESAQRASDARWRAIIDSAVDGIVVIDAKGTIESFNSAAERLFGYRAQEVLGRNVNLLMPAPHRHEHDQYLANYLAGGPAKVIGIGREITARRQSGEEFPARLAVGELSVDGDTHFTGIVHDLTERVQMEQRLRDQTVLAQLGEMAAVVAHEFRNALAAVRGAVQVIAAGLPAGSREASVTVDIVARLDALNQIVHDMLQFAHLPEPRRGPVDFAGLVASTTIFALHDPTFRDVRVEVVGAVPLILGDADLLRIVLLNLFTNAAQAMGGAGLIHVVMDATATSCRIVVADHGPGVPAEARERLFTPFFTTKARGSGLGLVTAKRIVEAHAGHLRVECPLGGGTRVVLEFPFSSAV